MRRLLVLGATGSVGRSTLDVAGRHPERIEVAALAAHRDVEGLLGLIRQFRPPVAALADESAASDLREQVRSSGLRCEVLGGANSLHELAADAGSDVVMSSIVGAVGLMPTLAAVRAGKTVLIANKEPLVMCGDLLMAEAARRGATVIPIDSEHNAIFQCLPVGYRCGQVPPGLRRLILTASGGPFRESSLEQLGQVTPEQAVRHPNWVMGPKISVDSATLMNKGLELIEAAVLYRLPPDRLEVVIHPESLVHSLVEYVDGSTLAQLGQPDMRVPIAHALAWPERWTSGVDGLDWTRLSRLRFEPPDLSRFPCLRLARQALNLGGNMTNVLNAANEVGVSAFLSGRLRFMGIPEMVESCCEAAGAAGLPAPSDLEAVLATDAWTRRHAQRWLEARSHA
ncbi:MAG: 1-deoxy-D-xylulose-5-phosphate reductoisomerase [Panacagrimonas sp.]